MKTSFAGHKPMLRKAVFLTPICVTRERMAKSPCKSRVFENLADGILGGECSHRAEISFNTRVFR